MYTKIEISANPVQCGRIPVHFKTKRNLNDAADFRNVQDYQRIVPDWHSLKKCGGNGNCPGLRPHCTGLEATRTRTRNSETFCSDPPPAHVRNSHETNSFHFIIWLQF